MRWAYILLVFLLSFPAWGGQMSFSISGKPVVFVNDPLKHTMLSETCAKKRDCEAYTALAKASLREIHTRGGANPGAVLCGKVLGGEVVIGKDRDENENSFCRFDDGSMVSCGTLAYYGRKNDLKQMQ